MEDRPIVPAAKINNDLLHFVLKTPLWFWFVGGYLSLFVLFGVITEALMITFGLHILGYNHNVMWAVFITNFIFWVGMSQAGVMISAILRLTHAEWRRPITRPAEAMAIFAMLTSGVMPLIHTGRVWRTMYWFFPYDFTRMVWPNIRSALIWDPSALVTYISGTILFVYVDLVPDLALVRDRTTGWRHRIYGALALGFRGTARQWRIQKRAGFILSAFLIPVFILVHSIVAWDLAMAILPGWHSTVFAPYFVIGAIHSGLAAVVTTVTIIRLFPGIGGYITRQALDTLGRIQLFVAPVYFFFLLMDMYFGLFAHDPVEHAIWTLRLMMWPNAILSYTQIITAFILPFPFLLFPRVRRSYWGMFALSISINIGMWLERYILVITPLEFKQPFTFFWMTWYQMSLGEWAINIGCIALVALGVLLFAKVFPIIPIWDFKEGQVVKQEVQIGRRRFAAAVRE